MNRLKISNVSLSDFRKFLRYAGCVKVDGGDGGHEKWKKEGARRSIIIQTHIDPVPILVVKSNLKTLELSNSYFKEWVLKGKPQKP